MTPEIKNQIEQIWRGKVPKGYKETKVGFIPIDWIEVSLGDIYTERKEAGNDTLPLLMVSIHSGVSDGEVDEESLPKKVKRIEDKSKYKRAAMGDLVFNMMRAWQGAVGTVCTEGMVSPAYIVARPIGSVNPQFMNYYMKTSRMVYTMCRHLRICSVAVKKGIVDQIEHLGRSYAAANTSNYSVTCYGDIVYTKSPTGNFSYGIIKQSQIKENVAVSPLYGVYKPISFEIVYFLHTYFGYAVNTKNYLLSVIQKGAKNTINITNGGFLSNSLYFPIDQQEQSALAEIFIVADKEIELLQQSLEQEKQKKKALMQLLLTGIVRCIDT